MKKLLGFIDKSPLIWFHYIPLEILIVLFSWLMANIKAGIIIPFFSMFSIPSLIGLYFILLIGDNLIHTIIGKD